MRSLLFKLGVILIGLIIFGCAHEWGAKQPDGFMGMKWGESIEQCKEKGLFVKIGPTGDNVTMVIGKGSMIGDIGVEVHYFFYKNKLVAVAAQFDGEKDFNSLLMALKEKYGEPKSEGPLNNGYGAKIGIKINWELSNVAINIKYILIGGDGRLTYSYKPISVE